MNIYYYGSDGLIYSLGDNELYHYNHNHDALGRFAGKVGSVSSRSVSSPREYKRKANKLESLSTKGRAKAMKKEYKSDSLSKKGKNVKAKLEKAQAKKYRDISSKAGNMAKKTAGEAFSKNHYTVSEKIVKKSTERGKDWAVAIGIAELMPASGPVRGATYAAYYKASNVRSEKKYGSSNKGENPRQMYATKYSVKKTKNGQNSKYTSANKIYDKNGMIVPDYYTATTKTGAVIENEKKKRK